MLWYCYQFASLGKPVYYVYAASEKEAIEKYLCENGLEELPKHCTITRGLDH